MSPLYVLFTVNCHEAGMLLRHLPKWSPACRLLQLFSCFVCERLLSFRFSSQSWVWAGEKRLKIEHKSGDSDSLLFLSYSPTLLKSLFSVLSCIRASPANEVPLFGRDWVQSCGQALLPLRHGAGDCLPRMSNCGHQFGGCSCAAASRQAV